MSEPGDRTRVEEQPEPLARFNLLGQKRVHDPDGAFAWSRQLQVVFLNQPDALTRRQPFGRRDRGDGNVDGVPAPVAVLDALDSRGP
jgi:hypothetical protein